MPTTPAPLNTSTTTGTLWVEDVRAHLYGDHDDEGNALDGAYTAGSGQLQLRYTPGSVGPGTLLSLGMNTLRVDSISGQTVTVRGGWAGTTDANAADNAFLRVNPRFTDHRIWRALNAHLAALSAPGNGLFRVYTDEVTYNPAVSGYTIPTSNVIRVLDVRREAPGAALTWQRVPATEWDLVRAADSTDFSTGTALRLREGMPSHGVQIVYAAPYTGLSTTLSDLVSLTGISAEAEDIPPLGAAINLMAGREIPRNQLGSQGSSRRASEVPPGAVGRSYSGLAVLWARRVHEEAGRLAAAFPVGR